MQNLGGSKLNHLMSLLWQSLGAMGAIISRFRKKKTSLELLQSLEDQIKEIEKQGSSTEQRHKKIVGQLLVYSMGLYILFGVFCWFYFPTTLRLKIFYLVPLILFPVILILIKRLISWYYTRKLKSNRSRLAEMKQEKKRLLEEVMDKETYKVAKDILEKFAPESLPRKIQPALFQRPNVQTPRPTTNIGLRKRSNVQEGSTVPALKSQEETPGEALALQSSIETTISPSRKPSAGMPLLPLPAPILPRDKNYIDRVVEYLIGDGQANRYALICAQCHSHNGMALKEEFEYIGYRCCYCFAYNPARKQRPEAPKLPIRKLSFEESGTEGESETMSSDTDEEHKEAKKIEGSKHDESAISTTRNAGSGDPIELRHSTASDNDVSSSGETSGILDVHSVGGQSKDEYEMVSHEEIKKCESVDLDDAKNQSENQGSPKKEVSD